ncbi:MAG TPA: HPr(Ser) kinase/phosphatase [Candidatus Merdibacter merdavium]|uniref:HPr kinase/phosphorylase n=1 Tax=Candidatus Merdibacter merdavium TaxID=2838692 RepID=A0A9D2NNE2_9FIRM|nr:HPr(Ser) kinase/phosphatase [Candidatus Merdibacter merdavium]
MADKRVTVKEFADYFQFEQLTGDEQSLKRGIELTDTNRPGLELAGFFDYSQAKRLVILGDKEIAYIATMSEKAQKRSFDFLTGEETPAIVITRGHECPKILRECALEKNFPVFCCEEKTNHTIVNIITWLDEKLAKSVSVHGELLIIYGTGVMICGESGMGKSEIALELIKRGHQLVADDRVDCYRIHNHLVGKSPQLLEGMLELRGVGVINIARMYGVGAVAHKANVDIQITLEEFDPRANYDRVGIEEKKNVSILDVEVPKITIPVREGRSMGVIIESAVTNYMLAKDGLDSAKEFEQRVLEFIEKNKEESDAAVS